MAKAVIAMTSVLLVDVKFLDAVISDNGARWLMFVQRKKCRVVVNKAFQL